PRPAGGGSGQNLFPRYFEPVGDMNEMVKTHQCSGEDPSDKGFVWKQDPKDQEGKQQKTCPQGDSMNALAQRGIDVRTQWNTLLTADEWESGEVSPAGIQIRNFSSTVGLCKPHQLSPWPSRRLSRRQGKAAPIESVRPASARYRP